MSHRLATNMERAVYLTCPVRGTWGRPYGAPRCPVRAVRPSVDREGNAMDTERRTFDFTSDQGMKFRAMIGAEYGQGVVLFYDATRVGSGRSLPTAHGIYTGASYFVEDFRGFTGGLSLRIETPRFDLSAGDVARVQEWLTGYMSRFEGLPVTFGETVATPAGRLGMVLDASDSRGDWEVMVSGTVVTWVPVGDVIRVERP